MIRTGFVERSEEYFNLISEKYEVLNKVACTAHAEVFLVKHKVLQVLRIAKIVNKNVADSERILHEANFIKNFKHSGIPLIYDIEEDSNSICIIEEYISGKSLTEYMKEHPQLTEEQIAGFGIMICKILEYLHDFDQKGIVHLDLKPDNIIIDGNHNIRLIDFDNSICAGELLEKSYGSAGFAAPEQYHRLRLERQADIYSLGMLIVYMVNGGHIQSIAGNLHRSEFYPIIKKCTRHNATARYKSIVAVKNELTTIMNTRRESVTDQSHTIYVYGSASGTGTTHVCLCIAAFLSRNGYKVVCVEHGDYNDLMSEALRGRLTKDGTYYLNGVYLLPNYRDKILCNLDQYQFRVIDCGKSMDKQHKNESVDEALEIRDLRILVCNRRYRRKQEDAVIRAEDNDTIVFMNLLSGSDFYECIKNMDSQKRYYRIPCLYEWYQQNEVMDEVLKEAFSEAFSPDYFQQKRKITLKKGHMFFGKITAYIKNSK